MTKKFLLPKIPPFIVHFKSPCYHFSSSSLIRLHCPLLESVKLFTFLIIAGCVHSRPRYEEEREPGSSGHTDYRTATAAAAQFVMKILLEEFSFFVVIFTAATLGIINEESRDDNF